MSATSPDGQYRIRRYDPADRPALLAILSEVWGDSTRERCAAIWDWKFERNPHNPPGGHGSLVIEYRDEAVGFLGFLAARFRRDQAETTLVWGTELCIRPDHRGMGYLVFKHIAEDEPLTVAGNAGNRAIYDLQVKFGAYEVTRWVNCKRVLDGRRFLRGQGRPWWLAAPGGLALDLVAGLGAGRLRRRAGRNLRCRPLAEFDERCDAFWAEAAPGYPFIGVRDRDFLTWRFSECPIRTYHAYGVFENELLRGYVVVRDEDDGRMHRGLIVDILTLPGDTAAFGALVAEAERHFRATGAAIMSCTVARSQAGIIDQFRRCGLSMRTPGIPVTAHTGNLPEQRLLESDLRGSRNLYLTRADTDLDYNY